MAELDITWLNEGARSQCKSRNYSPKRVVARVAKLHLAKAKLDSDIHQTVDI